MKTVVSVIGKDAVGITAKVSRLCGECNANILDITQSVLQDMFVMVMLTEIKELNCSFAEFSDKMKALGKEKLDVKLERLKNDKVSSMMTLSEESRRMQDMMKMYNMYGMDPSMFGGEGETLVLNANHPLVKFIFEHKKSKNASVICEQLYDLAMLQNPPLTVVNTPDPRPLVDEILKQYLGISDNPERLKFIGEGPENDPGSVLFYGKSVKNNN